MNVWSRTFPPKAVANDVHADGKKNPTKYQTINIAQISI